MKTRSKRGIFKRGLRKSERETPTSVAARVPPASYGSVPLPDRPSQVSEKSRPPKTNAHRRQEPESERPTPASSRRSHTKADQSRRPVRQSLGGGGSQAKAELSPPTRTKAGLSRQIHPKADLSRRSQTKADHSSAKHSPEIVAAGVPPASSGSVPLPGRSSAPEIPSPSPPQKEEKAGKRRLQGSGGKSFGHLVAPKSGECGRVAPKPDEGGRVAPKPDEGGSAPDVPRVPEKGKTSPVKFLESAIAARHKSQTELANLTQLLAEKSARQTALETTGDLHNATVLAEIARLQIFTALLPRRIAAQEQDDVKAEQSLTATTNQFIREQLGPRVRQLAARTRAIVEAELSSHFRDPAALIVAVARSERVRHLAALDRPISLTPPHGALDHAQATLQAWSAADAFENHVESNCSAELHSAVSPNCIRQSVKL